MPVYNGRMASVATKQDFMLYPIGIQNFEDLRKGGYIYVDKTEQIHRLVSTGKYYFLSRPRRFGKSLLVSSIESYMSGRKDLFNGLALEKLETEWAAYPVLHLDLSGKVYNTAEDLDVTLDQHLCRWEASYGVSPRYQQPDARFKDVIDAAYAATGHQVVILIDEYDKPIIDNLDNPALQDHYRSLLQGFYGVMKAKDGSIRLGFLTGVTKIGKMSVFSGLNNLNDISMDSEYSDICGISDSDLHKYFPEPVNDLAERNSLTEDECYSKLKEMYDGDHFSEDSEGMYNPFSLLSTLQKKRISEYWFETGTPSFLVKILKQTGYDITRLSENDVEIDSDMLSGVNDYINNPIPLLYQSGYLTIREFDRMFGIYRLGFPNMEVKKGFTKMLLTAYAPVPEKEGNVLTARLYRAVTSGKPEEMMRLLEGLFARANYQIQGDAERDFQYAMYLIFELLGEYVRTEYQTSNGRIDILLQTEGYIYIIEIKTDSSADEALAQIEEKGYAKAFAADSRKIFKIGVNFDKSSRRIEEWKVV